MSYESSSAFVISLLFLLLCLRLYFPAPQLGVGGASPSSLLQPPSPTGRPSRELPRRLQGGFLGSHPAECPPLRACPARPRPFSLVPANLRHTGSHSLRQLVLTSPSSAPGDQPQKPRRSPGGGAVPQGDQPARCPVQVEHAGRLASWKRHRTPIRFPCHAWTCRTLQPASQCPHSVASGQDTCFSAEVEPRGFAHGPSSMISLTSPRP